AEIADHCERRPARADAALPKPLGWLRRPIGREVGAVQMPVAQRAAESGPVVIAGHEFRGAGCRAGFGRLRLSLAQEIVFGSWSPSPASLRRKIPGHAIEPQQREITPSK